MNELQTVTENAIVVQSNELVEANYKLSPTEQKLILALASQIDTRKDNFEVVRVTAKSLSEACGFNIKGGYRQLQQTAKKILNRSLIIRNRNNNDWDGTHWVQYCKYRSIKNNNTDCSYIEVEFDKRLCPHLLKLSHKFLKANLNQLVSFKHRYSIRFYMIFRNLVNNLPNCTKKYTFKDILQLLELPKSYEKTVDLKNKVIKVATDEINEKSDIEVKYEYYREGGRAHIGVIFTFWKKTNKKEIAPASADERADAEQEQPKQITSSAVMAEPAEAAEEHSIGVAMLKSIGLNPPPKTEKKEKPVSAPAVAEVAKIADRGEVAEWTDEQQVDYDELLKKDVWPESAEIIVNTYDHERIRRNLEGVLRDKLKGTIANPPAVIVSAIKADNYKGIVEEQAKAREREQVRKKAEFAKAEKEKEEQRAIDKAKSEEMAKIREQYTAEKLNAIMEEVKKEYNNGGEMTGDMENKLKNYGITPQQFYWYRKENKKIGDDKKEELRTNKLEKAIKKEEINFDFEVNESEESVDKIIKAYYANGKKCPNEILVKLNQNGYNNWNDFASKHISKIMA